MKIFKLFTLRSNVQAKLKFYLYRYKNQETDKFFFHFKGNPKLFNIKI